MAAHAHGAEAIKRAVRAGVASIEHGSLLDDEGIKLMKERGTYLVADIYNDEYIMAEYKRLGFPETIMEKERLVGRHSGRISSGPSAPGSRLPMAPTQACTPMAGTASSLPTWSAMG